MINKLKTKFNSSQLLKGSSISFLIRIMAMLLGYVLIMLISNYYGAEALGIYSLSFVFIQMIAIVGRLGMDTVLVKYIAEFNNNNNQYSSKDIYLKVLKITVPFSIILSLICFYSTDYIAINIFNKEYLSEYLKIATLAIVPYTLIFINSESLRGINNFKQFIIIQSILSTFFTLIVLVFVSYFFEKTKMFPLMSLVFGISITFFISKFLWFKELKIKLKNSIELTKDKIIGFKELFKTSLPLTLTSYLAIVISSSDIFMLGIFSSNLNDVGIYSVVLKISSILLMVLMAVNTINVPKFSSLWSEKKFDEIELLCSSSTKLVLIFSIPLFLIVWFFPNFIMKLFGGEFEHGSLALVTYSLGQFLIIISGPAWQMFNMTNKQKTFLYISMFTALLNIILNYILIPIYGLNGAAIATTTSNLFLCILCVILVKKQFNILIIYIPFRRKIKNVF